MYAIGFSNLWHTFKQSILKLEDHQFLSVSEIMDYLEISKDIKERFGITPVPGHIKTIVEDLQQNGGDRIWSHSEKDLTFVMSCRGVLLVCENVKVFNID